MMNLGAALGSAVQGYQQAEQQNLGRQRQQAELDLSQRRMRMAEEDQAWQNEQRKAQREEKLRADQLRLEAAKLFNEFYSEREEQVGETVSDDGLGGKMSIPTVRKVVKLPGNDKEYDNEYERRLLKLQAQYSRVDPAAVEAMRKRVDELQRTKEGQMLDRVLSGDESAISELLKASGKDPEGAKLDNRPLEGVKQIVLKSGEKLDLMRYARAKATVDYANSLMADDKKAVDLANASATRGNLRAETALKDAQASVVPAESRARINSLNAESGLKNAQAAVAGEQKSAIQSERVMKTLLADADKNFPSSKSPDGEVRVHPAHTYVKQAIQSAEPGKEREAAAAATRKAMEVVSEAETWSRRLIGMKPEERKKRYGTSDIATIRDEAIRRQIATLN